MQICEGIQNHCPLRRVSCLLTCYGIATAFLETATEIRDGAKHARSNKIDTVHGGGIVREGTLVKDALQHISGPQEIPNLSIVDLIREEGVAVDYGCGCWRWRRNANTLSWADKRAEWEKEIRDFVDLGSLLSSATEHVLSQDALFQDSDESVFASGIIILDAGDCISGDAEALNVD